MDEKFFVHFLLCTLLSSLAINLLLLAKRCLKRHISARWQYNIDVLFLALLCLPLIPVSLLSFVDTGAWLTTSIQTAQTTTAETSGGYSSLVGTASGATGWLQDFTMSVDRFAPEYLASLFMIIWLAGILVFVAFIFMGNRRLRLIKESCKPQEDGKIAALFRACKAELGIKKNIVLGTSILARSPMTLGFFRPWVILPAKTLKTLSKEELRSILLHELTHCKNGDILINKLMCLFQTVYWFNPLVYIVAREMRSDRELACDSSVLSRLSKDAQIAYGNVLLNFASSWSPSTALALEASLGGSKHQIKMRIEAIAYFVQETSKSRAKSVGIFALMGVFALCLIPTAAALEANPQELYHLESDRVEYEDLSSYYNGYEGSFVLYDLEADSYRVYNKEASETRVSPASTYKLYSALFALDAGIIDAKHSTQEWDGTSYPFEEWNRNQDLSSALQSSVSWYFQDLDAQLGKELLASYYEQLAYGNHDLSGGIANYWMESSLLISPVEQVQLLADLYQNETIFRPDHVKVLKEAIVLSEKGTSTLSGKTGTGSVNGKMVNGWFVGYVETDGNTFVFATNIQGEDAAGGSVASKITLSILEEKGIY